MKHTKKLCDLSHGAGSVEINIMSFSFKNSVETASFSVKSRVFSLQPLFSVWETLSSLQSLSFHVQS
jgi:hypothetical protein